MPTPQQHKNGKSTRHHVQRLQRLCAQLNSCCCAAHTVEEMQQLRVDLASAYRVCAALNMHEGMHGTMCGYLRYKMVHVWCMYGAWLRMVRSYVWYMAMVYGYGTWLWYGYGAWLGMVMVHGYGMIIWYMALCCAT